MEVFVFHWGCTSLGALGDDQRGPTLYAREGTEPVLPLQDIFWQYPYIHVASDDAFCAARNEKHPECPEEMEYCICFSNPLKTLKPSKTVE